MDLPSWDFLPETNDIFGTLAAYNATSPRAATMEYDETRPLLNPGHQNGSAIVSLGGARSVSSEEYPDALPGVANGKTLSWTSAYILVVSRVIGSGIFATPGSIVKSAGSIGLTLLVWLVGTILAACGLAVSMEFGCMLPRSGGDKVDPVAAIRSRERHLLSLSCCRYTWSIPTPDRGF